MPPEADTTVLDTPASSNELILDGEDDALVDANVDNVQQEDDEADYGGASDNDRTWALRNGWVPRAAYRGDQDEWVDAKTFADRGRGVNSILKRRNAELISEIDSIKTEFRSFAESSNIRMKRELDARLASASERRKKAVAEGDTEGFEAAERDVSVIREEIDALTPKPAPARTAARVDDRPAIEWYERNKWYKADQAKTRIFESIASEVRVQNPALTGDPAAFLAEVDRRAAADYPERFGGTMQPRQRAATTNRPPAITARRPGEKVFSDLPKAAQEQAERFMRKGMLKKETWQADYLKNYDWDAPQ